MDGRVNRRWVLSKRPFGEPRDDDFRLETAAVPEPGAGELLVRNAYLSIDPYMRGRMNDAKSYAEPVRLGEVMVSGTIGQVERSRASGFEPGDWVVGYGGWQDYSIFASNAPRVYKVDATLLPPSAYLGVAGMPGHTAYFGLTRVGLPKAGETVVVSSAAGAVGSAVGQIATMLGCHAVGIAGGKEKCEWVRQTCGFVCVDYKHPEFESLLARACPRGVDIYFENVGGPVTDAVAPLLNDGARVPICGIISMYNATAPTKTPFEVLAAHPKHPAHRFFGVTEWLNEAADATQTLATWVRDGKLRHREDIRKGLQAAPETLRDLLNGGNRGKMLVELERAD